MKETLRTIITWLKGHYYRLKNDIVAPTVIFKPPQQVVYTANTIYVFKSQFPLDNEVCRVRIDIDGGSCTHIINRGEQRNFVGIGNTIHIDLTTDILGDPWASMPYIKYGDILICWEGGYLTGVHEDRSVYL